jgi:predicted ATPase/transcriptional regulator with XRE-family HTH domain
MAAVNGPSAFGYLLKLYRTAAGLTQEALAARAQISVRAISDLERGINRAPHEETLWMLSEALELRADDQTTLMATGRRIGEASFARLRGRDAPHASRGCVDPQAPSLVGRQRELTQIGAYLARGGPSVCFVAGEAGSGKTRILWEVARGAGGYGMRILEGGCHQCGQEAYAPLLPAVAGYIHGRTSAELKDTLQGCAWLARLLPELADGTVDAPVNQAVSPSQERRLICEASARLLARIAGPGGTLLVLDDMQWADPEALDLLAMLLRSDIPCLRVVGAYNEGDAACPGPLARFLAECAHAGPVERIRLPPLPRDAEPDAEPDAEGAAAAAAAHAMGIPPPAIPAASEGLPASTTPLIGRAHDVAMAAALLRTEGVRLLTLTGPGGVGKTSLALRVAADAGDLGLDRLVFVPLAPVDDPALVAPTLLQALGQRESAGDLAIDSVIAYLRGHTALLIIDNFEHLLPAGEIVAGLLAACPRLRVLVTSRAPLHIRGEYEYPVPPLAWPDPGRTLSVEAVAGYGAVELFVDRVMSIKPDFRLTAENAELVAAICARLDGLPLALELAAARSKLLPPRALLAHLSGAFDYPPLRVLTGGARDLPARLQTMHNAIGWSYNLLTPPTQRLFQRLAVFVGGCTVEAAQAVSDVDDRVDVLDGLAELVDQSLLRSEEQPDGEVRLAMLETVRQFAAERLSASGEREALEERHAAYYVLLADVPEIAYSGPKQTQCYAHWEREHNNLRAALRWAQAHGQTTLGLRMCAGLWDFWTCRGYVSEGRGWLESFLAEGGTNETARTPDEVRARALNGAALLAWHQGDLHQAQKRAEESAVLYRALGDPYGLSRVLNTLGLAAEATGDLPQAQAHFEQSLSLAREAPIDVPALVGLALSNLAEVNMLQRHLAQAEAQWRECLALFRSVGTPTPIAYASHGLAEALYQRGDFAHAAIALREALESMRETLDVMHTPDSLDLAGLIMQVYGRIENTVCLFGAAAALRHAEGADQSPNRRADVDDAIQAARARLGEETFATWWAEGSALEMRQAITTAIEGLI